MAYNFLSSFKAFSAGKNPFESNANRDGEWDTTGNTHNTVSKSFIAYPTELQNENARPCVVFRNLGGARAVSGLNVGSSGWTFALPIPQSLEFTDAASYDDANLGAVGKMAMDTSRATNQGGLSDGVTEAALGVTNKLEGGVTGLIKNAIGQFGDQIPSILGQDIGAAVNIGLAQTANKYITTEFSGMNTRTFGFAFKLYPRTPAEVTAIKQMCYVFRLCTYPEINNTLLNYPPTWRIDFVKANETLKHIPRIYESYLQDTKVTYNGDANNWYEDGAFSAPTSFDLSLTFKETRALTAEDIAKLG